MGKEQLTSSTQMEEALKRVNELIQDNVPNFNPTYITDTNTLLLPGTNFIFIPKG